MKADKAGTDNLNQKHASPRLANETEQQISPLVKFNPRQASSETDLPNQHERPTRPKMPHKTLEDAPTVDSTKGGI